MAGTTKREKKAAKFHARKAGVDAQVPEKESVHADAVSEAVVDDDGKEPGSAETSVSEAADVADARGDDAPASAEREPAVPSSSKKKAKKRKSEASVAGGEGAPTRTVFNDDGEAEEVTVAPTPMPSETASKPGQKYIVFVGA